MLLIRISHIFIATWDTYVRKLDPYRPYEQVGSEPTTPDSAKPPHPFTNGIPENS
jgi:hypothetical protein